jgi:hypothetical protein
LWLACKRFYCKLTETIPCNRWWPYTIQKSWTFFTSLFIYLLQCRFIK